LFRTPEETSRYCTTSAYGDALRRILRFGNVADAVQYHINITMNTNIIIIIIIAGKMSVHAYESLQRPLRGHVLTMHFIMRFF
jgi:hypothetical protein